MQVSGFRIYFLEPGYFFSKILSEFRKKIVALQEEGGNPCLVTINADELTADQMQAMTHDFGVESAFLMKPTRTDCKIEMIAALR